MIILIAALSGTAYRQRNNLFARLQCFSRGVPFLPVLDRNFEFVVDLYGVKYRGNTSNYVDAYILHAGAFEKPILYFMQDYLRHLGNNKAVVLDVGANTGQHSLFLSRVAHQVHAFEPFAPLVQRITEMIELNGINNITLHPIGLGDRQAEIDFFAPSDGNLGTGSFSATSRKPNHKSGKLQIEIGDEVLAAEGVDGVALIKVDVEGYEKPVLRGLRRTLEQHRPVVVMELNLELVESFRSAEDFVTTFPARYVFFGFSQACDPYTGRYELEHFAFPGGDPWDSNILAVPVERLATLPMRGPERNAKVVSKKRGLPVELQSQGLSGRSGA